MPAHALKANSRWLATTFLAAALVAGGVGGRKDC